VARLGPEAAAQVEQLVRLGVEDLTDACWRHFVVVKAVPAVVPLGEVGIVARMECAFVHDHGKQVVRVRHGVRGLLVAAARNTAVAHIKRERKAHLKVHLAAAQCMLVPLELHAQHGWQRVQFELLDCFAALLAVAAPVGGFRQLLWCTVAHKAALQRVRTRLGDGRRLVALLARVFPFSPLGHLGAHLEAQIQEWLARMRDALARRARHAALQAPPKREVHDTRTRRVMVGRARPSERGCLGVLAQLFERRRIIPRTHWQLDAVVCVARECGMNPVQRTNEHFVRIVLPRARKL